MNYPSYCKSGHDFYAILSEHEIIAVNITLNSINPMDVKYYAEFIKNVIQPVEIDLLEFYEAMSEVHKNHFRMIIEAENKAESKQLQTT